MSTLAARASNPPQVLAVPPPSHLNTLALDLRPSNPQDSALDVGGWDAYGSDWRHFFECMVAPQARQALPALDKLDLMAVPAMGTVAVGSTGPSRAVDFGT